MKQIYNYDMEKIKEINGNSIYRIMSVIMKQIVFTSKEVQELSGVSSNAASRNLKKLVELNIIVPDTQYKKNYRYKSI